MNALVIGGTGFIGSNLVRHLIAKGRKVKIFSRKSASLRNLEGVSYTSLIGDITDEPSLLQAMEGCDIIYNLAACGSSLKKDRELRLKINVAAAGKIARAARKTGGVRLVHVSSVAAVGTPGHGEIADETFIFNRHHDHYACTKHLGEQAVLEEVNRGLEAVIACPGNVVGFHGMKEAQLNTFKRISERKMRVYPPGGVCITDIDDLVSGLELSGKRGTPGKRYILGGYNVSFRKYFSEIAAATDGAPPKIRLPRTFLTLMGACIEPVFRFLGKDPFVSKVTCDMISTDLFYSSDLAMRKIGYSISDFRDTIRKAAKAVQKKRYNSELSLPPHTVYTGQEENQTSSFEDMTASNRS